MHSLNKKPTLKYRRIIFKSIQIIFRILSLKLTAQNLANLPEADQQSEFVVAGNSESVVGSSGVVVGNSAVAGSSEAVGNSAVAEAT